MKRALMLTAATVAVFVFSGCTSAAEGGARGDARVLCEEVTKDGLKSPSTADFHDQNETWDEASGRYRAEGTVSAENSFGGTVDAPYSCEFEVGDDDKLVLVSSS